VGPRAVLEAVVKRKIPSPRRKSNPRTSCTPTKSNLYFSNPPTTDLIAPTLQTPNVPSTKSHVLFPLLRSCQRISSSPRRLETFCNKLHLYGAWLLAPRPTPKLEDHPLSVVRDCLFNIFADTLRVWRPSLHPQPEDALCRGERGTT
jgi:hypothetical protein